MSEKEYHRLTYARPRSGFAISSVRTALWLGNDHLLCIDTTGYTETYKRFYFRDIQVITIRRSNRWLIWNIIFGTLTGIFGLIILAFVNSNETAGVIFFGGLGSLFLLLLVINICKGPTTICHLRTAVQNEELAPLNRLRRARKVLDRLRPLIAKAQGQVAPNELQLLMNQMSVSSGVTPRYPQPSSGDAPLPPPP